MLNDIELPSVKVLDSTMAYRETGPKDAPVALFLHGNPTLSYIWRHIMADVSAVAHCIAPDLIGFGQSGKPDIEYRFVDHVRYLDAFLQAMEFIRPMASWEDFHQVAAARELFQKFRARGIGEKLILEDNVFIERVLPGSIMRQLSEAELDVYRAPFDKPETRRPVWRLPNELPVAGEPADVWAILEKAHAALRDSHYPKMLFVGDPGALVSPDFARRFASSLKNCEVVPVGSGAHYLQEDHPAAIASGVKRLIATTSGRNA